MSSHGGGAASDTKRAAEALQAVLGEAYNVLGRCPDTVTSISDEQKLRARIAQLQQQLADALSDNKGLRQRIAALEAALAAQQQEAEKASTQAHTAQAQLQKRTVELRDAASALATAEKHQKATDATLEAAQREKADLQRQAKVLREEIAQLHARVKAAAEQHAADEAAHAQAAAAAKARFEGLQQQHAANTAQWETRRRRWRLQREALVCRQARVDTASSRRKQFWMWRAALEAAAAVTRGYEIAELRERLQSSENDAADLSETLEKRTKLLEERRRELKAIHATRAAAQAVAVQTIPVRTAHATTQSIDPKQAHWSAAHMSLGGPAAGSGRPSELDEIARLRFRLEHVQREMQAKIDEQVSISAFLEAEAARITTKADRERADRHAADKRCADLRCELAVAQQAMARGGESVAHLHGNVSRLAEDVTSARLEASAQLRRAADAERTLNRTLRQAAGAMALRWALQARRPFFERWGRFVTCRRHEAAQQRRREAQAAALAAVNANATARGLWQSYFSGWAQAARVRVALRPYLRAALTDRSAATSPIMRLSQCTSPRPQTPLQPSFGRSASSPAGGHGRQMAPLVTFAEDAAAGSAARVPSNPFNSNNNSQLRSSRPPSGRQQQQQQQQDGSGSPPHALVMSTSGPQTPFLSRRASSVSSISNAPSTPPPDEALRNDPFAATNAITSPYGGDALRALDGSLHSRGNTATMMGIGRTSSGAAADTNRRSGQPTPLRVEPLMRAAIRLSSSSSGGEGGGNNAGGYDDIDVDGCGADVAASRLLPDGPDRDKVAVCLERLWTAHHWTVLHTEHRAAARLADQLRALNARRHLAWLFGSWQRLIYRRRVAAAADQAPPPHHSSEVHPSQLPSLSGAASFRSASGSPSGSPQSLAAHRRALQAASREAQVAAEALHHARHLARQHQENEARLRSELAAAVRVNAALAETNNRLRAQQHHHIAP